MEDLHTDTLCDYSKNQENTDLEPKRDSSGDACTGILNGCEEIDPLDLMDNCDNESIGSNSDVWKGSDSEEENCEKENSTADAEVANDNSDKVEVETSAVEEVERNKPNEDKAEDETKEIEEPEQIMDETTMEKPEQIVDETPLEKPSADDVQISEQKAEESAEKSNKDEDKAPDDSNQNKELVNTDSTVNNALNDDINKDPCNNSDIVMVSDDTEKDPLSADTADIIDRDPLADNSEKDNPSLSEDTSKDVTENRLRNMEGIDDDVEMDYDADDDDFDPSLLCPEVSMAIDENPVVTTNGPIPNDNESDSPLPYEPVFSTFVDDVTGAEVSFNLTPEEQELRKRLYGPTNPIQYTRIHCTACNVHLGSALEGQNNRFVHPMLKVLICKGCYHFYTSGEFEKDEDGSELYCRWCGQGGQVLCCSKCECVFCKRCIRTNFGRKKMFEIRDSDSWDCFRCNTSQLITQRIACYEFFEYVRREISRASTLNGSDIWSKDYARCCGGKKRSAENGEEVRKPKRKKGDVDPDYNPLADKPIVVPNPAAVAAASTSSAPTVLIPLNKTVSLSKPIQFVPRYNVNKPKDNDIEFVRQIPAPQVTISANPRATYRAILPSHLRPALQPPTLVRISSQPVPPLVPTGNRILGNALQGRSSGANTMMKHEWFEKTVRAAARVNSHLSYTLTQLNKAQSQAASVEELAVVHNKLQEILSSSINSLIQIRKNLRTEFIAGIKTVRLPTKKVDNNDDDVIFVSAPTVMPMPSTSQNKQTAPKDPLIIIDKSNTVPASIDNINCPVTSERPRLKVKSVMELQNVPSECITIPDDTPAPPDNTKSPLLCNGKNTTNGEVDPLADTPSVDITSDFKIETVDLSEDGKSKNSEIVKKVRFENVLPRTRRSKGVTVYNLKEEPDNDIKKMMSVNVRLEKVDLEELQRKLANRKQ